MKICYVNKGISIHDQKFLKFLVNNEGFEVHLLSYHSGEIATIPGLVVHQIPLPKTFRKLSFIAAALVTPLMIRKIKPDIVHGNYLLTYGFYSALANYHPLLQMAWGSDVLIAPKNWLYRPFIKYALKCADLVTVDCESGRNAIIELGYPAEKIIVFPWGVDLTYFNPKVVGDEIRQSLGWDDNLIVVCTRRHESVYGLNDLIDSIPEIITKCRDARFLFIGDGTLTEELKQQVIQLGVEEYVKFTGEICNSDIGRYLATSDVYVSPSLSDGASVSLLEAMACGMPVVVTDVEAIMEWVEDSKNGFIVPVGDSSLLADKICLLIENGDLRNLFGKRNYEIIRERAIWDDNVQFLKKIYYELIENR